MTSSQIVTVAVLAVLLLLILPMYKSRTGKDFSEVLVGRRKKSNRLEGEPEKKSEPHLNNGTAGDLRYFLTSVIKAAARKGMKVVAPGRITFNGKRAEVTAYVVTKSGIIGVMCLGFNGSIRPGADEGKNWIQHMNGEDITFENPLKARERCRSIVRAALDSAGITAPISFVTVFTTNGVKIDPSVASVEGIFLRNRFIDYLKNNAAVLSEGDVDVVLTAKKLADIVGIDKLRAG